MDGKKYLKSTNQNGDELIHTQVYLSISSANKRDFLNIEY